jgi:hypothetical protein
MNDHIFQTIHDLNESMALHAYFDSKLAWHVHILRKETIYSAAYTETELSAVRGVIPLDGFIQTFKQCASTGQLNVVFLQNQAIVCLTFYREGKFHLS